MKKLLDIHKVTGLLEFRRGQVTQRTVNPEIVEPVQTIRQFRLELFQSLKAHAVVTKPKELKPHEASKKVADSILETLTHMDFPVGHWKKIRRNNATEHLNREIRRRTRVVGTFPNGQSALMLVCARLRHMEDSQWGNKVYLNSKHLDATISDVSSAG